MMKIIIFFTFLCYSATSSMFAPRPFDYNPGPAPYYSNKQCPNVNCTKEPTEELKPCTDDNECLQKQVCCNYPCQEGKNFCMKGNMNYFETHIMECLVIKNCKKWKEEHKDDAKECEDNGDCARSEKCCFIPCLGKRTCQQPVEVILNSGAPIFKPMPGYAPAGGRAGPVP